MNLFVLFCTFVCCYALPEQTRFYDTMSLSPDASASMSLDPDTTRAIRWYHATLFNNTRIRAALDCTSTKPDQEVEVRWLMRSSKCSGDYLLFDEGEAHQLISNAAQLFGNEPYASYLPYERQRDNNPFYKRLPCEKNMKLALDDESMMWPPHYINKDPVDKKRGPKAGSKSREKRDAAPGEEQSIADGLGRTWTDGPFILIIDVKIADPLTGGPVVGLSLTVDMKSPNGYLSAIDEPLYAFYGVMCIVYTMYALGWFTLCVLYWRDLLRVQYWIGAVIALGLMEKAVFLMEFERMNRNGELMLFTEMFAELISVIKRTLARILIILVSLGFGIVKPRLGHLMKQVLGAGLAYMVCASLEAASRVYRERDNRSPTELFFALPLATVDAIICYWIMSSLLTTLKNLKLRRNVVKLTLYRHFFNVLAFCVFAALLFIGRSLYLKRTSECFVGWDELWLDVAYWHLLFCLMLCAIMALWRPSVNNQRYAFSPLFDREEDNHDDGDDYCDDDDDAASKFRDQDGVKIRPIYKSQHAFKVLSTQDTTEDENLRWVEDHIPSMGVDSALPARGLGESDEEAQHTRQELNKMQ